MEHYKYILGLLTMVMSVYGHLPYIRGIVKGDTKPHIFTWVIWIVMTAIAFAAQITKGAGPGAWATGVNVILAIIITLLAFRTSDKNITRADWIMFISGIMAIPVWAMTKDPLWSMIIVTIIDALAFGPTIRKSWYRPYEEVAFMYGLNIFRHAITLLALASVNATTAMYPIMLFVMNSLSFAIIMGRRQAIKP